MPTCTETDPRTSSSASDSSAEAAIHIILAWHQCCFWHGMRNFIADINSSGEAQEDMLPARPARMPFLWTRTSKLKEVWEIVRVTRLWPDLAIRADSGALCFAVNGFSMARLCWDGRL